MIIEDEIREELRDQLHADASKIWLLITEIQNISNCDFTHYGVTRLLYEEYNDLKALAVQGSRKIPKILKNKESILVNKRMTKYHDKLKELTSDENTTNPDDPDTATDKL